MFQTHFLIMQLLPMWTEYYIKKGSKSTIKPSWKWSIWLCVKNKKKSWQSLIYTPV